MATRARYSAEQPQSDVHRYEGLLRGTLQLL